MGDGLHVATSDPVSRGVCTDLLVPALTCVQSPSDRMPSVRTISVPTAKIRKCGQQSVEPPHPRSFPPNLITSQSY
jgi:hypothetical protein